LLLPRTANAHGVKSRYTEDSRHAMGRRECPKPEQKNRRKVVSANPLKPENVKELEEMV